MPPVTRGTERELLDIGVFLRTDALALGFTARQIEYRLASGRWCRVAGHGLSVTPRPPEGWPPLVLARAASLTWPGVVVGYRVAGLLHGFPVPPGQDVHVLSRAKRRPLRGVVPHLVPWSPGEVVRGRSGVLLTSQVRTAVDCLADLPPDEGLTLYAWLTTHGQLSPQQLSAAVRAGTLRRGNGRLREMHRRTSGGALSLAEHRMHVLLRQAGIDGWEPNARILDGEGRIIAVVDLLFPQQRVVIEVDGLRAHQGHDQFVEDRRRQNRLINSGYRVLRFTWWDITERPARVLSEIQQALAT